jgi:hypothetical protein
MISWVKHPQGTKMMTLRGTATDAGRTPITHHSRFRWPDFEQRA